MSPRLARFLVIVLSPILFLTTEGRRISRRLPVAAWSAAVAGFAAGLLALATFAVFWEPPAWGLLVLFLFVGVHVVMGLVEAFVAARILGGGRWRTLCAIIGAAGGHSLWALAWFGVNPLADELTLIILTILLPGALLGAAGATMGAALSARTVRWS